MLSMKSKIKKDDKQKTNKQDGRSVAWKLGKISGKSNTVDNGD